MNIRNTIITLFFLFPVFGKSQCTADFTWIDTAGYTYFISSTSATNATYYWDFGDGNYGYQQNPSNIYWNPGTYTVCLFVYDANQVFCDSTCHSVTVQGAGGCAADFTWVDSLGYIFFLSNSTVGNTGYYIWDFGDGNHAYTANPSHQYLFSAPYTVCLTVLDSNQVICDTVCHTVYPAQVGVDEFGEQSVFGASPNPADDYLQCTFLALAPGEMRVTLFDAAGRVAQEDFIPVTNSGETNIQINTSNLPQGIYLVKLEMNGTAAWKKITLTHQ